jgi:hypothetical protein
MTCKLIKCYIWSMCLYGAEIWVLQKTGQKYLESFETWCWRSMEKISWTNHLENEVWHTVERERNISCTVKQRKASWISHMLHRNCLLKQIVEERTKGKKKWGGRHKQLLDDLKEKREYKNFNLEALDQTYCRLTCEEAVDLSQGQLHGEHHVLCFCAKTYTRIHAFVHTHALTHPWDVSEWLG